MSTTRYLRMNSCLRLLEAPIWIIQIIRSGMPLANVARPFTRESNATGNNERRGEESHSHETWEISRHTDDENSVFGIL